MVKSIVLVFTISIISIMGYRFLVEDDKHQIKSDVKTQKHEPKNNDFINQNMNTNNTKINTAVIQRHTNKISKTTKKNLSTLDTASKSVKKEEIFVDYLEDKTAMEIMDDSSLTQKEKDVMIMDKMYFDGAKDNSSVPIMDIDMEALIKEDMDYQLSNK